MNMMELLKADGLVVNESESNDKEKHFGCPFCGTVNDPASDRFRLTIATGKVVCRTCGKGANYPIGYLQARYGTQWRTHAERLGVEVTGSSNGTSAGKRVDLSTAPVTIVTAIAPPDLPQHVKHVGTYATMETYCTDHLDIPVWLAEKYGWTEIKDRNGHPAIQMAMHDGSFRIRKLNPKGFYSIPAPDLPKGAKVPAVWYQMPDDSHELIVLCNGQASTLKALYHGINAFCFTDGEGAIPKSLLKLLKARFAANKDTVCIIALDGDDTGRKAAKTITAQLAGYPIRVVDFGGDTGYDLADFCKKYKTESLAKLTELSRPPDNAQVASSSQVQDELNAIIIGAERFPRFEEYVPVPFEKFHKFGGMMEILHPGLVTIIGAPSGLGKTSFMETWVDAWLQKGFDVLWWGSEWSEFLYGVRRIQRYGGMNVNQYANHKVWKRDEQLKVPLDKRSKASRKLPHDVLVKSLQEGRTIKSWPGKCWYFPDRPFIEDTQTEMRAILHQLRREGRRPAIVVWDYISLLRSRESNSEKNQPESVLASIKSFSKETGLATLTASQVLKSTEDRIRSGEKVRLTTSDLYYIRPDSGNLILGLNPIYKKMNDEHGEEVPVFTNKVRAEILKNSLGQPFGDVYLKANFKYLSFAEF